jgi:hypothetical protein
MTYDKLRGMFGSRSREKPFDVDEHFFGGQNGECKYALDIQTFEYLTNWYIRWRLINDTEQVQFWATFIQCAQKAGAIQGTPFNNWIVLKLQFAISKDPKSQGLINNLNF